MKDKWEHVGPGKNIVDQLIGVFSGIIFCTKETIRLKETGEYREVFVAIGQSIKEAVDNGQFTYTALKDRK
jgi:hypothetical protein